MIVCPVAHGVTAVLNWRINFFAVAFTDHLSVFQCNLILRGRKIFAEALIKFPHMTLKNTAKLSKDNNK